LSPGYGFAAAGLGSALADVFSGYVIYAPATFVIKGIMALVAHFCYKRMHTGHGSTLSRIIGGALAEVIMIGGYYVFEGFMYGFAAALVNIAANAAQGIVGLVVGLILIKIFEKAKIF